MKLNLRQKVILFLVTILIIVGLGFTVARAATVLFVPQGGTGNSSFSNYPIVGAGSTGALTASSTPTIVSFHATSTTATSTIAGNLDTSNNVEAGSFQGVTSTSTLAGVSLSDGTVKLPSDFCSGRANGGALTTDASGFITCEDDESTAGGEWTDTGSILHPSEETVDSVAIGGTTEAGSDIFLGVDGRTVFNEQGASVDFKIESNLLDPAFFVDGGSDRIGIGTSTPGSIFSIEGVGNLASATSSIFADLLVHGISATSSGITIAGGNISLGTNGVVLIDDGDGALTILSAGNGSNEDITFNLDDVANTVDVTSSTGVTNFDFNTLTVTAAAVLANGNDGGALGASGTAWSDLFLASGGVINWSAGDVTLTHSSGLLTLSSSDGFTMSGAFINSDGSLEIPNGTAPTVNAVGEIAIDTSASYGQLIYATSTDANSPAVLVPMDSLKFEISTSTLAYKGAYSASGTTTLIVAGYNYPVRYHEANCIVGSSGNGTSTARVGDGTNWMEEAQADDRPGGISTTLGVNNTFTAREAIHIEIGSLEGTVDAISCDFSYFFTRE